MTLQTSGQITLLDLQGEFGGTLPVKLTDYYAGGGLVPAGTTNASGNTIPSSGTIKLTDFYGASAVTLTLTDHGLTAVGQSYAEASFTLNSNGNASGYRSSGGTTDYAPEWAPNQPNTTGGDYEARATLQSGSSSGTMGSWLDLATSRTWIITAGAKPGTIKNATSKFLLEIRDKATQIILTSATITLTALADNT